MIGIVGGVGPYAGIDLLKKIFDNTDSQTDQDHLDTILLTLPSQIADRTEYLIGKVRTNPGFQITDVLLKLEQAGATVAGIPCNTAHASQIFNTIQLELAQKQTNIQLFNMIDETVSFISQNYPKLTRIGVLSTTGTYKFELYKSALELRGYEVIRPSFEVQETLIHPAIYAADYGIKAISDPVHPQARADLLEGVALLKKRGAQAIIMGCTEIPLAIPKQMDNLVMIDPTNILARALIYAYNSTKLKPL